MFKIVKLRSFHFGLWKMSKWCGYYRFAFDIGRYRILFVLNQKQVEARIMEVDRSLGARTCRSQSKIPNISNIPKGIE